MGGMHQMSSVVVVVECRMPMGWDNKVALLNNEQMLRYVRCAEMDGWDVARRDKTEQIA